MPDVDLSEFEALSKPKKKPCAIGEAVKKLPDEDGAKLLAACAKPSSAINAGAIREWLTLRGVAVSVNAVTSHRQGTCTCAG